MGEAGTWLRTNPPTCLACPRCAYLALAAPMWGGSCFPPCPEAQSLSSEPPSPSLPAFPGWRGWNNRLSQAAPTFLVEVPSPFHCGEHMRDWLQKPKGRSCHFQSWGDWGQSVCRLFNTMKATASLEDLNGKHIK